MPEIGCGEDEGLAVGDCLGEGVSKGDEDGLGVGVGLGVVLGVGVAAGGGVGVGVGDEEPLHVQVRVEGPVIVKVTTDVPPLAGTLPVPAQPVQITPSAGDATFALMLVLLSNQPLAGSGESWVELTVK